MRYLSQQGERMSLGINPRLDQGDSPKVPTSNFCKSHIMRSDHPVISNVEYHIVAPIAQKIQIFHGSYCSNKLIFRIV